MSGILFANTSARLLMLCSVVVCQLGSSCRPEFFLNRHPSLSKGELPDPPDEEDSDSIGIKAITPAAGMYTGLVQVSLTDINGRKPFYHVRPFADTKDAVTYTKPFILYPPVTLYVGWGNDEKLTHLVHVDYKASEGVVVAEPLALTRFLTNDGSLGRLSSYTFGEVKALSNATAAPFPRLFTPDNVDSAWKHFTGTSAIRQDSEGDVIQGSPLDINRVAAWSTDTHLNLMLETGAQMDPFAGVVGWKIGVVDGLSEADAASNANITMRPLREVLRVNGALIIRDISDADSSKHKNISRQSSILVFRASDNQHVASAVTWKDLQLDPSTPALAVTGLTRQQLDESTGIDATYPVFLDANWSAAQQSLSDKSGKVITVQSIIPAGSSSNTADHLKYYSLAIAAIQQWLGMPVLESKEVVVLNFHDQDGAYGGYNAGAVGVASRLGPFTPSVLVAQLMAHEAAHHVNSSHSATQELWIQEGMSEWFAERFLYRHFPAATVYQALRQLRFDHVFEDAEIVKLPLAEWHDSSKGKMYAKALAFFDLLEAVVGFDTLRDSFQVSRQVALSSEKFRDEVLGRLRTGPNKERAKELFDRWVFHGGLDADDQSRFSDNDNDGILDWDEVIIGSNPQRYDSESNGYTDGERFAGIGNASKTFGLYQSLPYGLVRSATNGDVLRYQVFPWLTQSADFSIASGPFFNSSPSVLPWFIGESGMSGSLAGAYLKLLDTNETTYPVQPNSQGILATPPVEGNTGQWSVLQSSDGDISSALEYADAAYDIPAEAGAFDLTAASVTQTSNELTVRLQTRTPIDSNGYAGDYTIAFQTVRWNYVEATSTQDYVFHITNGYPHWFHRDSNSLLEISLPSGLRLSRNDSIEVSIPFDQLSDWTSGSGEKVICPSSRAHLLGETGWRDDMKCLSWRNPGMAKYSASVKSPMSGQALRIELAATKGRYSDAKIARTLPVLQSSLLAMEKRLGHPFRERTLWPVRLTAINSGLVYTRAYESFGAVVGVTPFADFDYVLPLMIEQLVRSHLEDIRLHQFGSPEWMEDLYTYWLTSSVVTEVLGSDVGLRYSHWRMDSYVCFIQGRAECAGFYAADRSLQKMSETPALGYSPEKIMMFAHALDTVVGSEGMSVIFRTFELGEWTNHVLLDGLLAVRPERASEIQEMWQKFVIGSLESSSDRQYINGLFQTSSANSWLYKFEADAITKAGGNIATYPSL